MRADSSGATLPAAGGPPNRPAVGLDARLGPIKGGPGLDLHRASLAEDGLPRIDSRTLLEGDPREMLEHWLGCAAGKEGERAFGVGKAAVHGRLPGISGQGNALIRDESATQEIPLAGMLDRESEANGDIPA